MDLDRRRRVIVLRFNGFRELTELPDGVRLDELLVVEVVKQQVQPLLRVLNLRRKVGGCPRGYAL